MTTTSTGPATSPHRLQVPGAQLHYEVRGAGPLVVLVGAPMDARYFAPLADLLATDHTVLTTDPRGVHRSAGVDDPDFVSTPELRADDLSRLIAHVGAGQAVVLGSSGGAVTALALAQAHPEQVSTVIAHEPPLEELLDDREELRAATETIVATYLAEGSAAAWARFMEVGNLQGDDAPQDALPDDAGPDGAAAGDSIAAEEGASAGPSPEASEPDPQEAADEHHFFVRELRATTSWQPDLATLRSVSTRIVVGLGENSRGELCDRTSRALTAALGTGPTMFPGGHVGFAEDAAAFAARVREVLEVRMGGQGATHRPIR